MFESWVDSVFVVDIETTGLDPWRNEILVMSISKVSLLTHEELSSELFRFRPKWKKYWSKESESIHGLNYELAMTYNESGFEWKRFLEFISDVKKPIPMVCHSLWMGKYFDSSFIDCQLSLRDLLFEKRKYISKCVSTRTMGMNFDGISGIEKSKSYSLKTLAKRFDIQLNHHNAESDRKACQKLFELFYTKGARDHLVYPIHEEIT